MPREKDLSMIDHTTTLFSAAELEQRLLAVEPGVVLAPPRILRRVLKKHSGVGGPGLQVPHRKSYLIGRDEMFAIANRAELDLPPERELPDLVVLLPQPGADKLVARSRESILRKYWRLLFHSRVHAALHHRRHDGLLTAAAVRERIRRLGLTEFAEIKAVLQQEHFLLPPGDDATVYEEFVALYLELHYFAPDKLSRYFPSLDGTAVERLLAEDVDADALLLATRLEGVSDPVEDTADTTAPARRQSEPLAADHASPRPALLDAARRAEAKGNLVRAALRRTQASATVAAEQTVEQLVTGLQKALSFSSAEGEVWRRGLTALLQPAASGVWPVEARLLFDLQKICLDHQRPVYAADLVEWVVSWGKKPVKRLLPYQGDVLAVKHLRVALRRLAAARLDEPTRRELDGCLCRALHHAEQHLRNRLRPVIERTLDGVDMKPTTAVETVARAKIVEELLDLIVERGFLLVSDLRDALARNRLKMPDLSSPLEFFRGDRLIRANRRFAESLDGVYRRGPIYLRWLQRSNSVAFGTPVGRFLTRYFALPLGLSFVLLEGIQHLLHLVLRWTGVITFADRHIPTLGGAIGLSAVVVHGPRVDLANRWTVPSLAVFILALLYAPKFRRAVLHILWQAYLAIHTLVKLPVLLLRVPFVRAIFESRPWLLFYQFVGKPVAYAVPVSLVLYFLGDSPPIVLFGGVAMFLATTLLFNSVFGQQLEEIATDRLVRSWHLLSVDVLPGLFHWIVYVSRQFLEGVERVIYTVDEWLRFRQGDHPASFYVKVVLGLGWFGITYVVRFAINLLIEPQINPIKHFPVVTVSHKLVLTMLVPPMAQGLALTMDPALAVTVATGIGFCIPGIFGFLVWELKENWKMYTANQSPTLDPEMVGSHGETVLRLLRPGFHSGTLPKLYAKLRRAKGKALHKQTEALHHVAECVRRFVERTLLATLSGRSSAGTE